MPGSNFFSKQTDTLDIALTDANGLAMLAKCTGVPPTTANIFQHGCLIVRTDSGTGNKAVFENTGSSAVPSWNLVGDVAASEIALAEGNVLVGNASGLATALNAKTNAQILVGNGTTITSVAVSGDATITNAGVVAIAGGVIVNADVNASAAIDFSKLATLASGNLLVGSAGGVATSVAMSGDATIVASGALTIAAGAVTPAKQTAAARTRIISATISPLPAPTGANQSNIDRYLFTAPQDGAIVSARIISATATSGSDATNQYQFVIRNSTGAVNFGSATTDTNGAEVAADTAKAITCNQNLSFLSGAVIVLRTNILDDGGAGPTNLNGATVKVEVTYTI